MIRFDGSTYYDIFVNGKEVLNGVHFDEHEGKAAVITYLHYKKLIKSNIASKYKVSVGCYTIHVETQKKEREG